MRTITLRRLRSIRLYESIAFIIGFVLMAYELVASRILAPAIGSSIYVWASVIGVIIAALSLGYAFGGIVADRRVRPADIAWLLLASALAILSTLLLSRDVLVFVASAFPDARLQGLVASTILFLPTSFLLGMISPYLARLRMISVETTGTTIASLSAMNSIGGIVGTFCAGFIFFGYMGSRETMILLVVILVATSWLVVPRQRMGKRLLATVLVGVLATAILVSAYRGSLDVATIDTPSSTYRVADVSMNGRQVRALMTGPGSLQSGIYINAPNELAFGYTRQMAALVHEAPKKDNILVLGGGAFTLPEYLARQYPASQIDVVEIDPQLVAIATQYFDYSHPSNVQIFAQDARAFLNTNKEAYDIILVDIYSDTFVPFSSSTVEYVRRLDTALHPEGTVIANIIGAVTRHCNGFLGAVHASYSRNFSNYKAYPIRFTDMSVYQNIVVAYSRQAQAWLPEDGATRVALPWGIAFTDNFAPVERLKQTCAGSAY